MEYVEFNNTYVQSYDSFEKNEGDIFASITIDGYPSDENLEGASVAEVFITMHRDIVVAWHKNAYRLNTDVLALIEESKTTLYGMYDKNNDVDREQGCANIYVKVHFDDGKDDVVKVNCHFTPQINDAFFITILNQIVATYSLDMRKTITNLSFSTKGEFEKMQNGFEMDVNFKGRKE